MLPVGLPLLDRMLLVLSLLHQHWRPLLHLPMLAGVEGLFIVAPAYCPLQTTNKQFPHNVFYLL
jgi:hypothetical protein